MKILLLLLLAFVSPIWSKAILPRSPPVKLSPQELDAIWKGKDTNVRPMTKLVPRPDKPTALADKFHDGRLEFFGYDHEAKGGLILVVALHDVYAAEIPNDLFNKLASYNLESGKRVYTLNDMFEKYFLNGVLGDDECRALVETTLNAAKNSWGESAQILRTMLIGNGNFINEDAEAEMTSNAYTNFMTLGIAKNLKRVLGVPPVVMYVSGIRNKNPKDYRFMLQHTGDPRLPYIFYYRGLEVFRVEDRFKGTLDKHSYRTSYSRPPGTESLFAYDPNYGPF